MQNAEASKEKMVNIERILEEKVKQIDLRIERLIPRKFTPDSLLFKINPPVFEVDYEALDKSIAVPFWDFLDRGGKRWRPTLFLTICEALGVDPSEIIDFAIIPEIIHNSTLIADDVEDSSKLRRGKPCTYELFGVDTAINLSDALFFLPLLTLLEKKSEINPQIAKRIYEIYIEEMLNVSLGQAIDISWHRNAGKVSELSENQYFQMCAYKTGALARMAARIAGVLSGADKNTIESLGRYAEALGIAFQIQDDILDLVGERFSKGKGGLGMDITEGKITLMLIHTFQKAKPEDKSKLKKILELHTNNPELLEQAIEMIKKYGSIDYAKKIAVKIVSDSWSQVESVLPSSAARDNLASLADFLIKRDI